jgi:acyl transferase domain-containing protein
MTNPRAIGSVKTNVGHLESAAGVAGLMKLILSLWHKTIPPHLHVTTLNPKVPWRSLPLIVPTEATRWPSSDVPRLGGVSAFGMSGTNVHLVVEEMPLRRGSGPFANETFSRCPREPPAASQLTGQNRPGGAGGDQLADFCDTAATGRAHSSIAPQWQEHEGANCGGA